MRCANKKELVQLNVKRPNIYSKACNARKFWVHSEYIERGFYICLSKSYQHSLQQIKKCSLTLLIF